MSKYVLNIENAKEKGQEGGEYRRGDDNEKADGDKAKVDDQPDVEEGEVAEGGISCLLELISVDLKQNWEF